MRIAFIGASHWHLSLYLDPARELDGVEVAAVSDPDPAVVEGLSARLGCRGWTDYRALCREAAPDFVFALGRHCDMAEQARFLIEQGVPFALEKPCGLDAGEVGEIARLAASRGAFAAVPLVFREGGFLAAVADRLRGERPQYAGFRFIAGTPARYLEAGCAWMLRPETAGGGCTINLAVHFIDLFRLLSDDAPIEVTHATLSNAAWGHAVEDYGLVTLRAGDAVGVVETGYLFPAPTGAFDMRFSLRAAKAYFVATGPQSLEVYGYDGSRETLEVPTTNVPHYRGFVQDVLARARAGRPPRASLDDMAEVMKVVDRAYALAGQGQGSDLEHDAETGRAGHDVRA